MAAGPRPVGPHQPPVGTRQPPLDTCPRRLATPFAAEYAAAAGGSVGYVPSAGYLAPTSPFVVSQERAQGTSRSLRERKRGAVVVVHRVRWGECAFCASRATHSRPTQPLHFGGTCAFDPPRSRTDGVINPNTAAHAKPERWFDNSVRWTVVEYASESGHKRSRCQAKRWDGGWGSMPCPVPHPPAPTPGGSRCYCMCAQGAISTKRRKIIGSAVASKTIRTFSVTKYDTRGWRWGGHQQVTGSPAAVGKSWCHAGTTGTSVSHDPPPPPPQPSAAPCAPARHEGKGGGYLRAPADCHFPPEAGPGTWSPAGACSVWRCTGAPGGCHCPRDWPAHGRVPDGGGTQLLRDCPNTTKLRRCGRPQHLPALGLCRGDGVFRRPAGSRVVHALRRGTKQERVGQPRQTQTKTAKAWKGGKA